MNAANWYFRTWERVPAGWPLRKVNEAKGTALAVSPHGRTPRVYTRQRLTALDAAKARRKAKEAEQRASASREVLDSVEGSKVALVKAKLILANSRDEHGPRAVLRNLVSSADRYGWTENRANFLLDLVAGIEAQAAERREREAREAELRADPRNWLHECRREIEGRIATAKELGGYYGPERKMLLVDDLGRKYWGTIPAGIEGRCNELVGKRVRLTATVKPKAEDRIFGFLSRPAKAEVLA
jgi:hypothetical protein